MRCSAATRGLRELPQQVVLNVIRMVHIMRVLIVHIMRVLMVSINVMIIVHIMVVPIVHAIGVLNVHCSVYDLMEFCLVVFMVVYGSASTAKSEGCGESLLTIAEVEFAGADLIKPIPIPIQIPI